VHVVTVSAATQSGLLSSRRIQLWHPAWAAQKKSGG
jgi:hypothetical protein